MSQRNAGALFLIALATYFQDVGPILNKHCVECHTIGAMLDLSRFPFVSQMTDDQNAIVERILIRAGTANATMPPGNRPKLSPPEVQTIEKWRDQGMPF